MQDQPLFSIIIPTHNRAKLLRKAIQSVSEQSVSDWEIIVIDDGSTDDTRVVVEAIAESRLHYYFQKNKERSAARNLGISKSKGQYVCFLDDDDYFLPNHLEALQIRIQQEDFPVAIFRTSMITKYEHKEVRSPFYNPERDTHPIPFFLNNMVGIHTLCYHQDIFELYRYDERWMHFQDTHLLILCLLKFPFFQIPVHTAVYMRYPEMGSISIFRMENAAARTENNVQAIRDLFRQGGAELARLLPAEMETHMVASKYLDHASGALHVGRKELALTHLRKAIKTSVKPKLWLNYLKFFIRYGLALLK